MDCSLPVSSVHGIPQARIMQWVAISFSRGTSQPRDQTQVSYIASRCFNLWATREALRFPHICLYILTLSWVRAVQFSSVQLLTHTWLFAIPWTAARQASLSITVSGVYQNTCPSSQWCHQAISSSVVPFSSCPQFLPESGSFPISQLFTWGGQSIGLSASASVLPMNTQGWCPLGWTGWILAVQGTLKSLLQHCSSKASIPHWAFFIVQLAHPYMTDHWENHSLD